MGFQGDEGGELDPHGADGNGNPIGGLVFSSAFGTLEQIHEWTVNTRICFFPVALVADTDMFVAELHVRF